jgi:hypothetical protein
MVGAKDQLVLESFHQEIFLVPWRPGKGLMSGSHGSLICFSVI